MFKSAFTWKPRAYELLQSFRKRWCNVAGGVDMVHKIRREVMYIAGGLSELQIKFKKKKMCRCAPTQLNTIWCFETDLAKRLCSVGDNKSSCIQIALSTGAMPRHSMRERGQLSQYFSCFTSLQSSTSTNSSYPECSLQRDSTGRRTYIV